MPWLAPFMSATLEALSFTVTENHNQFSRMNYIAFFFVTLATVEPVYSQSPAATSPPPPACTAPEFRQFDFWLGKWQVLNPSNGKISGTSEISRSSGGCVIQEQWKAAGGTTGMSINYYEPASRKWHQDWVGGDGTILHLQGELSGNAMVLTGESKTAKGVSLNRITWTPLEGGKVKQEWAASSDNGREWKVSFVGIYEHQP